MGALAVSHLGCGRHLAGPARNLAAEIVAGGSPAREGKLVADWAIRIYNKIMILWDETKRQVNLVKHGIDCVGAEAIFDEFMLIREDDRIADGEVRFRALGVKAGRVAGVVYTERGEDVRIISIRKATTYETERYFEARGY